MTEREQMLNAQLEAANRQIAAMAELLREAISVISSINHGGAHEVLIDGDEPAFWQRGEWVTWAKLEVLPKLLSALAGELPDHVAGVGKMVPTGWQLVPELPTPEMCAAYNRADSDWEDGWAWDDNGNRHESPVYQWVAMLAAAPKPEPATNGWLPIETAPRDGRKALVYRPLAENSSDEPIAVKRLIGGNRNPCWDETVPAGATPHNPTDGACHVTHWMPLPAAPKPQGGAPCDTGLPSSKSD